MGGALSLLPGRFGAVRPRMPPISGLGNDAILTPHAEYTALGRSPDSIQAAYRAIFDLPGDAEMVKALRRATAGGYALIGDQLKARLIADGERVEPVKPGRKEAPIRTTRLHRRTCLGN